MLRLSHLAFATLAAGLVAGRAAAQDSLAMATPVEGVTFRVFDGDGRPSSFAELLAAMDGVDVVLIGEEHDDQRGHELEHEILLRALERYGSTAGGPGSRPVVLSLEMFERDVQGVVDEYLAGLITERHLKASARPWPQYDSRYRPLVERAKDAGIPLVAANAPRRYVNRVTRLGPDSLGALSEEALEALPPLPYPGPSDRYREEWLELMSSMSQEGDSAAAAAEPMDEASPQEQEGQAEEPTGSTSAADSAGAPASPHAARPAAMGGTGTDPMRFALDAQALWDAAMAESIARAAAAHPGSLVLHMVGSFHVQNFTGIPEALGHYGPELRQLVIVMEKDDDLTAEREDLEGKGDFVVLTLAPAEGRAQSASPGD